MTSLEGYSLSIKMSTAPKHRPGGENEWHVFLPSLKGFWRTTLKFFRLPRKIYPDWPFHLTATQTRRALRIYSRSVTSALSLVHTLNENKMCVKREIMYEWLVSKSSKKKIPSHSSHRRKAWEHCLVIFGRLYFDIYFSPTSFLLICSAETLYCVANVNFLGSERSPVMKIAYVV